MWIKKLKNAAAIAAASMALMGSSFILVHAFSRPLRTGPPPGPQGVVSVPFGAGIERRQEPGSDGAEIGGGTSGPLTWTGVVEPSERVQVVSDVAGHLRRVAVDIGSMVRRGDIVAEIDAPELKLEVDRAAAMLQQARARVTTARYQVQVAGSAVKTARADVETAQAGLEQVEATANYRKQQHGRIVELVSKGALERRVGDEEVYRLRSTEANESEGRARTAAALAGLGTAQARLLAARAELGESEQGLRVAMVDFEKARMSLSLTRIASPIDGIVTRRNVHVGEFVRSAAGGGTTPIVTVIQTRTVRVVVQVPHRDAPLVHPGVPATFFPDSLPGRELQGQVSRTSVEVDPPSRTMRVEIDLDNTDGALQPGQSGRVCPDLRRREPVTSPR